MCNSCSCENIEKCAVRGSAPIGWCCNKCDCYNPLDAPCSNQFEKTKTMEYLILSDLIIMEKNL